MAKNILKEAIADAKAVREVALANAKAALEEAFTPKLKSMLSTKLSEELDEDEYDDQDDYKSDLEELVALGIDDEGSTDLATSGIETDGLSYEGDEELDLDEEVNLEDILNELGLEESDKKVGEGYQSKVNAQANDVQNVTYKASNIYEGCTDCDEDFNIDKLLEGINGLELEEEFEALDNMSGLNEQFGNVNPVTGRAPGSGGSKTRGFEYWQNHPDELANRFGLNVEDMPEFLAFWQAELEAQGCEIDFEAGADSPSPRPLPAADRRARGMNENLTKAYTRQLKVSNRALKKIKTELSETKKTLKTVKNELSEVNLLNSKLLYVNRIFKANNLSEAQKLRVVETIDKADSIKETKLIYETLRESFNNIKPNSKTKTIKENLGIASNSTGTTQSRARKNAIISESNDMVARFKKLANITIKQ